MHRKDCCELGIFELSDDIEDSSIVGSFTDQPTKIRRVKLPIPARRCIDWAVQFVFSRIKHALRFDACNWPRCCTCRTPPLPHEAKQEPRRHGCASPRLVDGHEEVPNRLGIEIPTSERGFRGYESGQPKACGRHCLLCRFRSACEDSPVL
jgi:hypothetical protein